MRDRFARHLLPLAQDDWETAHDYLRRLDVVLIDDETLRKQVEQRIGLLVYRLDGTPLAEADVRALLADYLAHSTGNEIRSEAVWSFLTVCGYGRRDWAADPDVRESVKRRNADYLSGVRADLVNARSIQRREATAILEEICAEDGARTILASGPAGIGKSCIIAQVVETLASEDVPVIVVRLDRHGDAKSTRDTGRQMELPSSPPVVLAGLANGGPGVLVIDQLDAVSRASGRYSELWEVIDSLCREAAAYPSMRVVVACRDFDLDHDHRLRSLREPENSRQIPIEPLFNENVTSAVTAAGLDVATPDRRQAELLRTPLHLYLFLTARPSGDGAAAFRTVGDLFERYWEEKRRRVSSRVGADSDWFPVVKRLCKSMNRDLRLDAAVVELDEWEKTSGRRRKPPC